MKLSKRLQKIADLVGEDSIVCDIGTDHGYIPVYLIKNNISKKVIGTDISKGSLDKIIELVQKEALEDRIECRLGDGLDILEEGEVDRLIIAGMGGILISEILEEGREVTEHIENFILQPMVGSKELRKYLVDNGYKIISEDLLFEEGKFYEIILAERGRQKIDKDIHYEISQLLIRDRHPLLREFLEYKINKVKKVMDEIKDIKTQGSKKKYKELKSLLEEYEEVVEEIES